MNAPSRGGTVTPWLALLHHSKTVLGSIPRLVVRDCVLTLSGRFSFPPLSKSMHYWLIGDSKLNHSVNKGDIQKVISNALFVFIYVKAALYQIRNRDIIL